MWLVKLTTYLNLIMSALKDFSRSVRNMYLDFLFPYRRMNKIQFNLMNRNFLFYSEGSGALYLMKIRTLYEGKCNQTVQTSEPNVLHFYTYSFQVYIRF